MQNGLNGQSPLLYLCHFRLLGPGCLGCQERPEQKSITESISRIPHLRREIPRQFDDATNRTTELINVLSCRGDAIIAAFEVEHTTAISSGLLRMSDLVSMQPNIKADLFIVAPDQRRKTVAHEIPRPTFARLKPPLPGICRLRPAPKLRRGNGADRKAQFAA